MTGALFQPLAPWFFAPLPLRHFSFIAIDPPWHFDLYSEEGAEKSALAQYPTMTDAEILALPVRDLAAGDCLLYCWATAPRLDLAIQAVKAWGFTYLSLLVWEKTTASGKMRWGTGYRVRTTAEPILVASIGNPKQAWTPPTQFKGVAREHSRKPEEFFALAERVMPRARRADIFAREERPGWATWGNQLGHFANGAPRRLARRAPSPTSPDLFRPSHQPEHYHGLREI